MLPLRLPQTRQRRIGCTMWPIEANAIGRRRQVGHELKTGFGIAHVVSWPTSNRTEAGMAKKPNYNFERSERERQKAAKKAERLQAKKEKAEARKEAEPASAKPEQPKN